MIIDADPGNGVVGSDVDDALAISLAVRSTEIELLAVTVVAGNVPVDQGVRGGQPARARRNSAGHYLAHIVRPWVTWLAARFGRDGCPLHDPLALAALLDPSIIRTRRRAADIELSGRLTRGRIVAWDPHNDELLQTIVSLPTARRVDTAYDVDNSAFMPLLLGRHTG
jgi:inosine-uridine nucleoside N-ribohydrolase